MKKNLAPCSEKEAAGEFGQKILKLLFLVLSLLLIFFQNTLSYYNTSHHSQISQKYFLNLSLQPKTKRKCHHVCLFRKTALKQTVISYYTLVHKAQDICFTRPFQQKFLVLKQKKRISKKIWRNVKNSRSHTSFCFVGGGQKYVSRRGTFFLISLPNL